MKRNRKMLSIGLAVLVIALAVFGMASCASTGQFMPLAQGETPVGNVQATFVAQDTWFTHDAINTLAYIKLLEAAQSKYQGNIEIRDIQWVSGRGVDDQNKEISATGKVIQTGNN
jgi:hypothetical protein